MISFIIILPAVQFMVRGFYWKHLVLYSSISSWCDNPVIGSMKHVQNLNVMKHKLMLHLMDF